MAGPLDRLFAGRAGRTRRVSSFDRTGGNKDYVPIEAGQTKELAYIEGPGVIRHIWCTLAAQDPLVRRRAVLRMYWDDEEHPSVEAPLGDFFGQGWGEHYNWASLPLAAAPRDGQALVCYFPMPFARSARITVTNESDLPIRCFYYSIDYERFPGNGALARAYALDDSAERLCYFHAWWNRELTAPDPASGGVENEWEILGPAPKHPSDAGNYLLLEAEGFGHVVGVNLFVDSPTTVCYSEGDDMWLVDGEPWPGSLHGTAIEDFFNTAWSPNEVYQHPYFGYARVASGPGWLGRTHIYRFFLEDPIRFAHSVRGSVEHGHANVLTLDLASVVYWYQTEPHRPFPPLPPARAREPMPPIDAVAIHRWRHAWRETMLRRRSERGEETGRPLWGHEPFS